MSFPIGVELVTVTVGSALTFLGESEAVKVTVKTTLGGNARRIVWAATGQPVVKGESTFSATAGDLVTFTVPNPDQPGFIDGSGKEARNWSYSATVTAGREQWVQTFQPVAGQTDVDLDLVPDGQITAPTSAPIPAVISVNGKTGAVIVEADPLTPAMVTANLTEAAVASKLPVRLSESDLTAAFAAKANTTALATKADLANGKVPEAQIPARLSESGLTAAIGDKMWASPSAGGDQIAAVLDIPTHDGNPQLTHPSALRFDQPWNGYRYWMAHTPYPDGSREDPNITASVDGKTWVVPAGLTNPLRTNAQAKALGADYWSDTELIMLDDTTMAVYFRAFKANIFDRIYVMTTANGVAWAGPTLLLEAPATSVLSPTVVRESDGSFTLWAVDGVADTLTRRTSADGLDWSAPSNCTIADHKAGFPVLWHLQVRKADDGVYWMLLNSKPSAPRLYWLKSPDGITWEYVGAPLPLTGESWDAGGHYRSSFVQVGNNPTRFDLYLAGINANNVDNLYSGNVWRVGYSPNVDPRRNLKRGGLPLWVTPDQIAVSGSATSVAVSGRKAIVMPDASGTNGGEVYIQIPPGTSLVKVSGVMSGSVSGPAVIRSRWLAMQSASGSFPGGADLTIYSTTVSLTATATPKHLVTMGTPTAGSYGIFKFWRDSTLAEDTLAGDARIVALQVEFVR